MTAPSPQDEENGMVEGRASDRRHPASPRLSFPIWGIGGPPPSNHSQFCYYFLGRPTFIALGQPVL
jgi:hypothetical protein